MCVKGFARASKYLMCMLNITFPFSGMNKKNTPYI